MDRPRAGQKRQEAEGWLLHRRSWQQNSLIWEFLTTEGERVGLVARGVRSTKGRAAPELCARLRIWSRGTGDLRTLTRHEWVQSARLRGAALFYALAANELIVKSTTRLECNASLGTIYGHFIDQISRTIDAAQMRTLYSYFQFDVLHTVGYGLDIGRDDQGHVIEARAHYRLDSQLQLRLATQHQGWSGAHLQQISQRQNLDSSGLAILQYIIDILLKMAVPSGIRSASILPDRSVGEQASEPEQHPL